MHLTLMIKVSLVLNIYFFVLIFGFSLGIYQCFASNEAGENYTSGQISIHRSKDNILPAPKNVKCFPINHSTIHVQFESQTTYKMMSFFMASKNPFQFISNPVDQIQNSSFNITTTKFVLRPFALFLRGYKSKNSFQIEGGRHNEYLSMTHLSKPVICSTQGRKYNKKKTFCFILK